MEVQAIRIVLRIVFCIICASIARRKNRSAVGWGIFGFLLPLVAVIWITCLKVHQKWENDPKIDSTSK